MFNCWVTWFLYCVLSWDVMGHGHWCSVAQVMDLDKPYFSEQRMVQPKGFWHQFVIPTLSIETTWRMHRIAVTNLYDHMPMICMVICIKICSLKTHIARRWYHAWPGSCGSHQLRSLDRCLGPFRGGFTQRRGNRGRHGTLGPRVTGAAFVKGWRDGLGDKRMFWGRFDLG